jgi:hypothetical protein
MRMRLGFGGEGLGIAVGTGDDHIIAVADEQIERLLHLGGHFRHVLDTGNVLMEGAS